VILIVVGVVGLRIRDYFLGETLVREVNRLSAPRPNAPNQLAAEGDYHDCVSRLPPPASSLAKYSKELTEAVAHVRDDGARLETLPADVRSELPTIEAYARAALGCARASTTSTAWGAVTGSPPDLAWQVRSAIALSVRRELETDRPDAALTRCTEVTLWARAVSDTYGLVGAMLAQNLLHGMLSMCVEAVDRSSANAKRTFLQELALVRAAFPRFSAIMELERAQAQVGVFLPELTSAQAARIPADARSQDWRAPMNLNPVQELALHIRWGAWVRAADARIAAADSPSRDADLVEIERRSWSPLDHLLPGAGLDGDDKWVKFAHRYDQSTQLIDLLLLLTRVDLREPGAGDGGWEYSLDEDGKPRSFVLHPDSEP
jgi:hypothetical protein